MKGVSAGRSSTINIFRSHAASIFPDIDPALFPKSVKRSQDPRICKLLGLTGDSHRDKTPPMLPPILFKDEDTQSISKLFRNPALFQVCLILSISFLAIFTQTFRSGASSFMGLMLWTAPRWTSVQIAHTSRMDNCPKQHLVSSLGLQPW